jgi:hypothetical protein
VRVDRFPLYLLLHLVTLPVLRMLNTPAHDGVRLFLPTFAFLAVFAGLGAAAILDLLAARIPRTSRFAVAAAVSMLILGPSAYSLARIHPFELSYYNTLVGGPRGAWQRGFELTYWYDAFTPQTLDEINRLLPPGAPAAFPSELSAPQTFQELQALGRLRKDIRIDAPGDDFPYLWLLTHDSKALAATRALFALEPWFSVEPTQLDGARVVTVADPRAAARAIALQLLLDAPDNSPPDPPAAPAWVREHVPGLARFWGDGLDRVRKLSLNEPMFEWADREPRSLREAARDLAALLPPLIDPREPATSRAAIRDVLAGRPEARRLYEVISRYDDRQPFSFDLLRRRPQALVDAVEILIRRPDALRTVMTRYPYTDPATVGGYLDADLENGSAVTSGPIDVPEARSLPTSATEPANASPASTPPST